MWYSDNAHLAQFVELAEHHRIDPVALAVQQQEICAWESHRDNDAQKDDKPQQVLVGAVGALDGRLDDEVLLTILVATSALVTRDNASQSLQTAVPLDVNLPTIEILEEARVHSRVDSEGEEERRIKNQCLVLATHIARTESQGQH